MRYDIGPNEHVPAQSRRPTPLRNRRPVPPYLKGALALLAAVLILAACQGNTRFLTSSHAVGDSPKLIVRSENGRIAVNAAAEGVIRIEATIRRPSRIDIDTGRVGDAITITAESTGGAAAALTSSASPGVDMEITAPPGTTLDLETSNGPIHLTGVRVPGRARTTNGAIVLRDAAGDFELTTSNGAIEVEDYEGAATLRTSDGAVVVSAAKGVFDIETSNGNIDLSSELTPGSSSRLITSNGNVTVALDGDPSLHLDASTSNGRILSRIPLVPSISDEDRLVGVYGEGGTELLLRTTNGSITLE